MEGGWLIFFVKQKNGWPIRNHQTDQPVSFLRFCSSQRRPQPQQDKPELRRQIYPP